MCGNDECSVKCARNTSFGFFMVKFVLFFVTVGSRQWAYYFPRWGEYATHGLWQGCVYNMPSQDGGNVCDEILGYSTELIAVQVMIGIAILCEMSAFIMYAVWMCKDEAYLRKYGAGKVGTAAMSLCLLSAFFSAIGLAVFGMQYHGAGEMLYWAFYASMGCAFVNILNSTIVLSKTMCCRNRSGLSADRTSGTESVEMPDGVSGTRPEALPVQINKIYPSLEGLDGSHPVAQQNVYTDLERGPSAPPMPLAVGLVNDAYCSEHF